MFVAKAAIKQPEVMVLKTLEEWDRKRKRRAKPRGEPVMVKLDDLEKTTMIGV